ncbi:MAG: hypothetical protein CMJ19_19460 [Phycisphaeraceae bacterium]|nr:hypothetical protein [Phycisphaeraceae bacterium]
MCNVRLSLAVFFMLAATCLTLPAQAQLVGYWPMEGDLNEATTGSNNAVAKTGQPTFTDEVPAGIKSSKALSLADKATVNIPHTDGLLDGKAFTVSLWFNGQADSPGMWCRIISKMQRVEKQSIGLEIQRSAKTDELHYRVDTLKGFNQHGPIGKLLNGKWHHVVFTFDGTKLIDYVDGKKHEHTIRAEKELPLANTADLILGQSGIEGNRFFTGLIDDVAVWKNVLTEQQIKDLKDGKLTPTDIK